ncbi:MAG: hypothetical protein R6U98_36290 [Pirellulaceae bacterium]
MPSRNRPQEVVSLSRVLAKEASRFRDNRPAGIGLPKRNRVHDVATRRVTRITVVVEGSERTGAD